VNSSVRRLLVGAGWTLAALAAFAVYLRLASTRAVNSDGASIALAAWDMLHGNVLLRGWRLADVTFFTTEVPQYALIELARGLSQDVVQIAAAMTYALVLLLVALVAKGTATGRAAAARVAIAVGIMLAPQLDAGTNVLLSSPDHFGTSVPLLLILLILDRVRRPRWWVPTLLAALLAWAQLADSVVLLAGVIPLAVVCAFRVARSRRPLAAQWYEISLACAALAGFALAQIAYRIIPAVGGYTERPLGTGLAPVSEIFGHNLPIAAQGLLLLPGADVIGRPAGVTTYFVALHLAGVAVAAAGIAVAGWRFGRPEGDLVGQLLLAGIVVNVVAFVATTHVFFVASAREIAPALPFAAALAGRELGPWFCASPVAASDAGGSDAGGSDAGASDAGGSDAGGSDAGRSDAGRSPGGGPAAGGRRVRRAAAVVLGLVLAGYLAGLGLELTRPSAPPQAAALTAWLESHPLGAGLAGYWEANVVTLTSGGRVAVRPVTAVGDRIVPTAGQVKDDWFDPARSRVDFVVLFPGIPGYPGFTDRQAVLATFGQPDRVYRVGPYTILWWARNLLPDLRSPGTDGPSTG
jgi:hypothetical protein